MYYCGNYIKKLFIYINCRTHIFFFRLEKELLNLICSFSFIGQREENGLKILIFLIDAEYKGINRYSLFYTTKKSLINLLFLGKRIILHSIYSNIKSNN